MCVQVVQGMQGSFSGQTMLSYAEQRHMLDSKMQEHSQAAWMQHTGGLTACSLLDTLMSMCGMQTPLQH